MTKPEYLLVQSQMMTLTSTLAGMRLDEYIEAMAQAKSTGPTLDPKLWRNNGHSMLAELEMARATRRWRSELHEIAGKLITQLHTNPKR